MAKIIEAKAVISAVDKTGAVFDNLAKKIDKLGKTSKTAQSVDRLTKAMQSAEKQMVAIDKFDASRSGFAARRKQFREAQADLERLSKAMAATKNPSQQLERDYRRAQETVSRTSRAFERQKNVILSHKRALEGMGVSLNARAAHQERLRVAVERTSRAIEHQGRVQERVHGRRVAVRTAVAGAGVMAGHATIHGAREVLHTYREFDNQRRFGKATMGLTDAEQAPLVNQAIHMGATTKFNDIQVLEAQRELAARGLNKSQIMGMMSAAANLGMSLDLSLPDAVKQMEGALFGFKKDISTLDASLASATRTADVQVKAAKISGMTPEDITQAYKYGATPARLSGISEETLLAFAGISKKANMGGDESGVAFRALMAAAQAPTRKAREALLANGLDYKNYQRSPDKLALDPFVKNVAAQYGVKLNADARAGIGRVFTDKALISDPSKFTPAIMQVLSDTLGGSDAKSKRSIAGMANRYRNASMQGVDVNAFIADLMSKIPGNLQLANAIFGSKQGGRIATALGDPATFKKMVKELISGSEGYATTISAERMAGFDGAVSRFEGSVKNLETAIGRAFDNDGKGGLLTGGVSMLGSITQWLAERDSKLLAGGGLALGAGGLAGAGFGAWHFLKLMSGGFGLSASATALDASAAALMGAATALKGGSAADVASDLAGGKKKAGGKMPLVPLVSTLTLPLFLGGDTAQGQEGLLKNRVDEQTRAWRQGRDFTLGSNRSFLNTGSKSSFERFSDNRIFAGGTSQASRFNYSEVPTIKAEVSGQVTGETTIHVKIEAPEVLRATAEAKDAVARLKGQMSNRPGSTGRSSPDAGEAGQSGGW
ncbi:MAG: phage tail tape measure protein [Afipia sp.]